MFFTYYLMFIDAIFLMFMVIIYREVVKNKNVSLASSFILLFIGISVVKFLIMALSVHYNYSMCEVSNNIFCKWIPKHIGYAINVNEYY